MSDENEVYDDTLAPDIWVKVASEIVRSDLRGRALEPRADTIQWLDALEETALAAIRAQGTR